MQNIILVNLKTIYFGTQNLIQQLNQYHPNNNLK